jgi:hypothetical protein
VARVNRDWLRSIWQAVGAGQGIDWADFEWYAVDRDGSLGMLTSAGPGPVPRSVFRDLDLYIGVVEFFGLLPRRARAEILVEKRRVEDWRRAAERGLYGFDYNQDGRRAHGYHLIARPEQPLRIEEVPEWVRGWLESMRLRQTVFRETVGTPLDLSGEDIEWL